MLVNILLLSANHEATYNFLKIKLKVLDIDVIM